LINAEKHDAIIFNNAHRLFEFQEKTMNRISIIPECFIGRFIRFPGMISLIIFSCMFFSACMTVGPDYVRPDMPVPDAWQENSDNRQTPLSSQDVLADWWATFKDPVLNALIDRAAAENLDLKTALSNVRQARISRGIAEADRYPSVEAGGSARRSYRDDETGDFSGTNSFHLGLDASWELDIFGGVKRSLEASDATLAASEESYHDVLVSLLAEVAMNYVDLRSYQARLLVAEANLKSQQETWEIAHWRYQAGLTTALDVELAKANLEPTRAHIPALQSGIKP
jgi:NodT family efflux transporter outer membrane factor (OMF) lipoprotein